MKASLLPENEQARLANLYSYQLLDTLPEKDYDDLTKLASSVCNTPISLITLLDKDRQWFKSVYGAEVQETPRDIAFCSHAILNPHEVMLVPDMAKDERFAANPLVTGETRVAFYAGVPLLSEDGYPLGSLCVIDTKPNALNGEQVEALKILANQAMRLIQLHKKNNDLVKSRAHLQEVNAELEKFAQVVANDLMRPCDTIAEITDIVIDKYGDALDVDGRQILSLLKYSADNVKTVIADTLKRSHATQLYQQEKVLFTFNELLEELKVMLPAPVRPILQYEPCDTNLYSFKKMMLQILLSFVSNGISYNTNRVKQVRVSYAETESSYRFTVSDNGLGLPLMQRGGLYEVFGAESGNNKKEYKEYLSNLNYARQLVNKLDGKMEVHSEEGAGSRFLFEIGR